MQKFRNCSRIQNSEFVRQRPLNHIKFSFTYNLYYKNITVEAGSLVEKSPVNGRESENKDDG